MGVGLLGSVLSNTVPWRKPLPFSSRRSSSTSRKGLKNEPRRRHENRLFGPLSERDMDMYLSFQQRQLKERRTGSASDGLLWIVAGAPNSSAKSYCLEGDTPRSGKTYKQRVAG